AVVRSDAMLKPREHRASWRPDLPRNCRSRNGERYRRRDRLALHGFDLPAHAVQPRRAERRIELLGIELNVVEVVRISGLVNSLKGVSSRRLREIRPEVWGRYSKGVLWSPSYFAASCGGAPLSIIAEYVRNQREGALPPRPEGRGFRAQDR